VADRLRVLLVLGPSTGGIGIHVRTLGEQLVQRGHDVSICAPAATQATFDWTGTRARFIPAAVAEGASAPGLGAWRALRRAGLAHDVVHAHGIRASAAAALTRAPALVATWHNAPLGGRGRRDTHALLERLAARGAAVTLGASEDLVDRARRAGGRDVRFAPVVAPPLPTATRPAAQVRDELGIGDRPLLLAVARLAAQKRLDLLVAATRGWSDRPDRPVVLVAGDGDAAVAAALRSQPSGCTRRFGCSATATMSPTSSPRRMLPSSPASGRPGRWCSRRPCEPGCRWWPPPWAGFPDWSAPPVPSFLPARWRTCAPP
jgi:hypothetical protein